MPCALLRSAGRRNGLFTNKAPFGAATTTSFLDSTPAISPPTVVPATKTSAFPIPHDLRNAIASRLFPVIASAFPRPSARLTLRLDASLPTSPLRLATSTTRSTALGTRFRAGWYMKTEYCAELNRQGHAGGNLLGKPSLEACWNVGREANSIFLFSALLSSLN